MDYGRDQAFLLPPDLRDWVPEDDLAHFVIEAVERVDLGAFKVNRRGSGSAQYHPRMMLALLIYCYANGIFSSRRIERATRRDLGVRFVAANNHPDYDTIATFRRENLAAVAESFLQVLLLAKELKLVKVGVVSVDGSKFDADASKHRSVRYDRAGELIEQLRLEIATLMERAEASLEASGIEALVATSAEGRRRRHDFRPAGAGTAAKEAKADWLRDMATKLDSEEGRALYRLRRQTVEPVFGVIKAVLGFTGFSLRGLDKVAGEWTLVALACNCKRLHKLTLSMAS